MWNFHSTDSQTLKLSNRRIRLNVAQAEVKILMLGPFMINMNCVFFFIKATKIKFYIEIMTIDLTV